MVRCINRLRVSAIGLFAVIAAATVSCSESEPFLPNQTPDAYWVWAGINPAEVPSAEEWFVYQGQFDDNGNFAQRGPSLQSIINAQTASTTPTQLHLVYRLHTLTPPDYLLSVHEFMVQKYQQAGLNVVGLQLDFDSPSAKLSRYAEYLTIVRSFLPADTIFSATGLATWLVDNPEAQATIHEPLDFIAYQFYQGRTPFAEAARYAQALTAVEHPYRIGVLATQERKAIIQNLSTSNQANGFLGFIVFVQKP